VSFSLDNADGFVLDGNYYIIMEILTIGERQKLYSRSGRVNVFLSAFRNLS
jgi:hypothetical protein